MMDENRGSSFMGLGGLGGGGAGLSKLSPYLNVDPTYLQTETPEYIFNQVTCFFSIFSASNPISQQKCKNLSDLSADYCT